MHTMYTEALHTLRWVLLAATNFSILRGYCIWRVLILAILSFVIAIFKCIVSYEVASRISGMNIIVSVTIIGGLVFVD